MRPHSYVTTVRDHRENNMRLVLPLSILLLASSVFWHSETNRYQIAILEPTGTRQDEGSFIKFDTRTAQAIEYCDLYKGYCQKWELWREQNNKELEK